jgi:hypothetical protein
MIGSGVSSVKLRRIRWPFEVAAILQETIMTGGRHSAAASLSDFQLAAAAI